MSPVGYPDPDPSAVVPRDPWERFGWVMATVWLLFLLFPITAVLQAQIAAVLQVAALGAIAGFIFLYISGFVRASRCSSPEEAHRLGLVHLVGMALLVIIVALMVDFQALGMVAFVVAFSMFILPLRWAAGVAAGVMAITVLAPLAAGRFGELWFFTVIVVMTSVATGGIRVLEERGQAHRVLIEERQVAAERDRMARDVHDVLGHSLTVISVKAELADRLIESDPSRARAEVNQIQSLSREALAEIRATIAGVRVARLGDEVEKAAGALSDAGIEAQLPADVTVADPRHRIVLAWVLREAVTNVVRHSRATRCQVLLGSSRLSVTDDGVGTNGRPRGQGLRGVSERVRAAGGSLSMTAGSDGRGTTLTVDLDPEAEDTDDN